MGVGVGAAGISEWRLSMPCTQDSHHNKEFSNPKHAEVGKCCPRQLIDVWVKFQGLSKEQCILPIFNN